MSAPTLIGERKGKRINLAPEMAKAGDITQLTRQFHGEATIHGIELCEGSSSERIMLGSRVLDPSTCLGEPVKPGSWVILLAKNEDVFPRSLRATLWMTGQDLQDEGGPEVLASMDPGAPSGGPPSAETQPELPSDTDPHPGSLTSPGGVALTHTQTTNEYPINIPLRAEIKTGAVVPGVNEFAVLLMHSDMTLLMDIIQNNPVVTDSKKPHLLKRFQDAFARQAQ
jgi:hypothetical protein